MRRKAKEIERTNEVLVLIAHGTEDMEAVIVIDILRRAGILVRVAGENEIITCAHGIKIIPDVLFDDLIEEEFFDAIIIPGGSEGVESLSSNPHIEKLLQIQSHRGGILAAICAAPVMIAQFNLAKRGSRITSHFSVAEQFGKYTYVEENVVIDRNIITSRGAGTAFEFALALVELLVNEDSKKKITADIMLPQSSLSPSHDGE
ncbi:MAG: DJ-1 family glyoxalase III [Candidatus Kapaibacterium sp.]